MKILLLGGTAFLGRHIAQAALEQGHRLTLFNRGLRGPELFSDAERLIGDRNGDVSALEGRCFDAVIDCSGYTPAQLQCSARALGSGAAHYTFVSSVSAYAAFPPGLAYDEASPLAAGDEGYGAQKARSEAAIEAAFGDRVALVRPGLIVGPLDPTGRFTHWPLRVARGGDVLGPGRPDRPIQFIDVRDLAQWCLHLATRHVTGAFNAVGPSATMRDLLDACRVTTGSDARWVWFDDAALAREGIDPWTAMPLWIPEHDAEFGGMLLADNRRALAAGLMPRPLADTVRDTWAWAAATPAARVASVGLAPEREAECLARRRPA